MQKLTKTLQDMTYEETLQLKNALGTGHLNQLVERRLSDLKTTKTKQCPVCGQGVTPSSFTLTFGPPELRQQASFDGPDCLSYFLKKVR